MRAAPVFPQLAQGEHMIHFFPPIKQTALAVLIALPACVYAAEAAQAAGAPAPAPAPAEAPAAVAGFGVPAASDLLDRARGGTDTVSTEATLNGAVTGNSATHVITGNNTIQASSFAGATGIPIVIQNTGANVLIQNATVINLQFR
jgi:hypothetical protein